MPRRSALVLVVFILCSVAAFGEPAAPTVPSSLQAKRTSMPLDHLYRHFLESQIYFDKEADKQQQKGQPQQATRLHNYYQNSLQFNNLQMHAIRQAALQMQEDTDELWTQARPIIDQDLSWRRINGPNAGHAPGHFQVDALQKANEASFLQIIARLNRTLGPVATARLQDHIQSHVTVRKLSHPLITLHPSIATGVQQ